tara:strand:+ start:636 stop:1079 length:444 start_codon:yes stop_codon:yes gene_type:complete
MILNFKKNKEENISNNKNIDTMKMVALLIHAAKIDENYSKKERNIIINFTKMISNEQLDDEKISSIVDEAEKYEKNSNQILEYTQEVKKMDLKTKELVLEFLWRIILSDDKSDVYESTLMRRICGLLYLPDKLSGEVKLKILKENNK